MMAKMCHNAGFKQQAITFRKPCQASVQGMKRDVTESNIRDVNVFAGILLFTVIIGLSRLFFREKAKYSLFFLLMALFQADLRQRSQFLAFFVQKKGRSEIALMDAGTTYAKEVKSTLLEPDSHRQKAILLTRRPPLCQSGEGRHFTGLSVLRVTGNHSLQILQITFTPVRNIVFTQDRHHVVIA